MMSAHIVNRAYIYIEYGTISVKSFNAKDEKTSQDKTRMSKAILTAERLVQLSQFSTKLPDVWYLLASSALSVLNQPQEIPKVYHYTLMLQHNSTLPTKTRPTQLETAKRTIDLLSRYAIKTHQNQQRIRHDIIESNDLYPNLESYTRITMRLRECILKTCPLSGLPRGINSLHHLHSTTPIPILNKLSRSSEIDMYDDSRDPCPEVSTLRTQTRTTDSVLEVYLEGKKYWNTIYNKVSNRVANDLNSSYPDLWYFTLRHVYGPILAFNGVLSACETSLVVIAALVPQGVPAQLRGHLRGALNVGCDEVSVGAAREIALLVAGWCSVC